VSKIKYMKEDSQWLSGVNLILLPNLPSSINRKFHGEFNIVSD